MMILELDDFMEIQRSAKVINTFVGRRLIQKCYPGPKLGAYVFSVGTLK